MPAVTKIARFDRSNILHRALFETGIARDDAFIKEFEVGIEKCGKLTMLAWWYKVLPEHFTKPAHDRYEYKERKRWYIHQKLRAFPESRGIDLIYSGELKRVALSTPRTQPSVYRRAAGYFEFKIGVRTTMYVAQNRYINMHSELIAIREEDREFLREVLSELLGIYLGYITVSSHLAGNIPPL